MKNNQARLQITVHDIGLEIEVKKCDEDENPKSRIANLFALEAALYLKKVLENGGRLQLVEEAFKSDEEENQPSLRRPEIN